VLALTGPAELTEVLMINAGLRLTGPSADLFSCRVLSPPPGVPAVSRGGDGELSLCRCELSGASGGSPAVLCESGAAVRLDGTLVSDCPAGAVHVLSGATVLSVSGGAVSGCGAPGNAFQTPGPLVVGGLPTPVTGGDGEAGELRERAAA